MLVRKFNKCSLFVKIILFKTYCMCVYDVALWSKYSVSCLNKFRSCYIKCMKLFLGYNRYDSVTQMLLNIGLPSFNTVMHSIVSVYLLSCGLLVLTLQL